VQFHDNILRKRRKPVIILLSKGIVRQKVESRRDPALRFSGKKKNFGDKAARWEGPKEKGVGFD